MALRAIDLGGELNPVDEFHSVDDFWQLVVAFKTAPTLLGALDQLEDHGEGGLVREASLGSAGPAPDRREGAFDWVCCSQMLPVLGGKTVEGQQRLAIFLEAFDLEAFDGTAVAAARPPSCASLELSATAPPCQKRPLGGNFRSDREPSGEYRFKRSEHVVRARHWAPIPSRSNSSRRRANRPASRQGR